MDAWTAVHGLQDQTPVDAAHFNAPIFELAQRTNYLYSWLKQIVGDAPFGSLRLTNVSLTTTGALAPALMDVVALDPATKTYVKAQSSMSLLDDFVAGDTAFAIGVLTEKQGSTGTVVVGGKLTANIAAASFLESGEVFRNGKYYLSATEPGKLTGTPSIPAVFVGIFTQTDSGILDYAILNVQQRDTGESHVHRAYGLYPQPAGQQYVTGTAPDDVHGIIGFAPDGTPGEYDQLPRLVLYGDFTAPTDLQYTIWLSTFTGTDKATAPAPTDWDDTYLHWVSTDTGEDQGKVQVRGYEIPVAVGSHGLIAVLENPTGLTPALATGWDVPYYGTESGVEPEKRTWTVAVPEQTRGWVARRYRQCMTDNAAVDTGFSMRLIGGPLAYDDGRTYDTVTAACADIFSIDTATAVTPADHTGIEVTVGVDVYKFEFTADGDCEADAIPVAIGGTDEDTYKNAIAVMLDTDTRLVPVISSDASAFLIGLTETGSVEVYTVGGASAAATEISTGAGNIGGTADLLVYDRYNVSLISEAPWIAVGVELWVPVPLTNGLLLLPTAYDEDGTPYSSPGAIELGDYWATELADPAPGAAFAYSMGMHAGLSSYYPPVPMKAACLELNGVNLDSAEFYPESPTYMLGGQTLYWYPDTYAMVPWPKDWASVADPGSDDEQKKLLLYFVRPRVGTGGYVTSLRPAEGSPLRVLGCGTRDDAVTGDLAIDVDLNMTTEDVGLAGYQVIKGASGNKLRRGPVVEKLLPGPGITITQNQGAPAGQGIITIGLANAVAYTGDFEEVALENAKQEMIGMFPYVRLLGWTTGGVNTPTAFTAKFRVPHTIENKPYRVVLYATVFGEDDVPYEADMVLPKAGLVFSYAVLPDVYPVGADVADPTNSLNLMEELLVPDADKVVEVVMGNAAVSPKAYKAYDPMLIHNYSSELPSPNITGHRQQILGTPFPNPDDISGAVSNIGVKPGSLVAVRFARGDLSTAPDEGHPEYTGALGFINLRWMLVSV